MEAATEVLRKESEMDEETRRKLWNSKVVAYTQSDGGVWRKCGKGNERSVCNWVQGPIGFTFWSLLTEDGDIFDPGRGVAGVYPWRIGEGKPVLEALGLGKSTLLGTLRDVEVHLTAGMGIRWGDQRICSNTVVKTAYFLERWLLQGEGSPRWLFTSGEYPVSLAVKIGCEWFTANELLPIVSEWVRRQSTMMNTHSYLYNWAEKEVKDEENNVPPRIPK